MKSLIIPFLLIAIGFIPTTQADIYKWTDKDGKVHYSATPPKDPQQDVEDIEDEIKANIGKVQPATTYKAPVATSADKTDEPSKRANTTQQKSNDKYKGDRSPARIAYCNNLKNNIHTMENNKNGKLLKEGEKEPLTVEQIEEQLKQDKAKLAKNCIGL